ncbi:MAG: hypothetical protein JWM95_727 [Gemmatimonadetes bacterium]|nr:hypothetical protein [Gemmatimonadota bacterium]
MSDFGWVKERISLNRVQSKGEAQSRELLGALRDDVVDVHRSGLTPRARRVVGRVAAGLVLMSGVAAVMLWVTGVVPLDRAVLGSRVEIRAPARAVQEGAPVPVGVPVQDHAPTAAPGVTPRRGVPFRAGPTVAVLGARELIDAVAAKFTIRPAELDTGVGTRLSIRYVDGPYSRLNDTEQRTQALAIARFVWRLQGRPTGIELITVRIERPMRAPGDEGVTTESYFFPAELNRR